MKVKSEIKILLDLSEYNVRDSDVCGSTLDRRLVLLYKGQPFTFYALITETYSVYFYAINRTSLILLRERSIVDTRDISTVFYRDGNLKNNKLLDNLILDYAKQYYMEIFNWLVYKKHPS